MVREFQMSLEIKYLSHFLQRKSKDRASDWHQPGKSSTFTMGRWKWKVRMREPNSKLNFEPRLCNSNSITRLKHCKSVASLRLSFNHSGAMLAKPNFLIYCALTSHYESYCVSRVKACVSRVKAGRLVVEVIPWWVAKGMKLKMILFSRFPMIILAQRQRTPRT